MKIKNAMISLAAGAAVVTFAGCNQCAAPAAGDTSSTNAAAKDVAGKVADTAKDVAGQAVAAGKDAVSAVTGQFSAGVANAKKFIADKNYPGALAELTKLSNLKLTDEQTKVADNLKAEVQALIAKGTGGAVDAAKGLLGK